MAQSRKRAALFNSGIHPLDTLRYLLGEVEEGCGFLSKRIAPGGLDDTACASLRFKSGVLASLITTFASPRKTFVNLYGTDANVFGDDSGLFVMKKDANQIETGTVPEVDPILVEQIDFVDAIKFSRQSEVDLEEGAANVAVIEALIISAERRRFVNIKEVTEE